MPDIFISYSRKDSEQALQLAERLQGEGMSVWIDQRGIEAAKTWSEEIVNAIEGSKAFVLLLSSNSVESINVAKELALAFEANRTLVPVSLEDIPLTPKFKYALAGIQRVPYAHFGKLTEALFGLGISQSTAPAKARSLKKSILVLPFDDLSPTNDNEWFADGLTTELINSLSTERSLRLIDRQTAFSFKHRRLPLATLAETLDVRYFIEGSVRKFEDQIKISVSLFDFEEGEYLWQDTHRGRFADVFAIQESVAKKVATALEIHILSHDPAVRTSERVDPEAYEHLLRGDREMVRYTREGYINALEHFDKASTLDVRLLRAHEGYAYTAIELYRTYEKDPTYLERAEERINKLEQLQGRTPDWLRLKSKLAFAKRDMDEAAKYARLAIEVEPQHALSYDMLGFALDGLGELDAAANAKETFARLDPKPNAYFNLLVSIMRLHDTDRLERTALEAAPYYVKHLKLNPDDYHMAVQLAHVYLWAKDEGKARAMSKDLFEQRARMDAKVLYNFACLYGNLGEAENALSTLRMSIERGFKNIYQIKTWEDSEAFNDSAEFQQIVKELEAEEAKAKLSTQTAT